MSNAKIYSSCVVSSRKHKSAFFRKAVWHLILIVLNLLRYVNHLTFCHLWAGEPMMPELIKIINIG